jgi:glycosyltransferase involved in cell wall biosynthesis
VRIAFYCDSRVIGGAEASLRNLLGSLSPRIEAVVVGVDADVVAWLAAARPAATTLVLPEITSKWRPGAIAEHVSAFRHLKPQILHVSLSNPWASHWALLAGICTPGVRTLAVEQSTWLTKSLRRRILKRVTSRGLAAHVAVGTKSADAAAAFSGIPRNRIHVIHNGVPEGDFTPFPRPVPTPIIGTVGRLEPEKGFDVLLRGLVGVEGATAVLVGEGTQRRELVELVDRLGLTERVLFQGWSTEPRRHLPTFDICVVPSRVEAFPLVVVEAMLASLPVVATKVGSVADAVLDGETGLLVPAEDPDALASALRTLLADPDRMREMGRRGSEHARLHFTANAMAARYESLYRAILD